MTAAPCRILIFAYGTDRKLAYSLGSLSEAGRSGYLGGRPKNPDGQADAAAPRIFAETRLAGDGRRRRWKGCDNWLGHWYI